MVLMMMPAPKPYRSKLILFEAEIAEGHTSQAGAFRTHVQRLNAFLQSDITKHLPADKETIVRRVYELISNDQMLPGDRSQDLKEVLAGRSVDSALWNKIELALRNAWTESGRQL
jgi:hypothetical protein